MPTTFKKIIIFLVILLTTTTSQIHSSDILRTRHSASEIHSNDQHNGVLEYIENVHLFSVQRGAETYSSATLLNPSKHRRFRRQVNSPSRNYIFPLNIAANTALFTIANDLKIQTSVQYTLKNDTVIGVNLYKREVIENQKLFALDLKSGVVSSLLDISVSEYNTFEFTIETTRDNDLESSQQIIMRLVQREPEAFTNQPKPIWVTIGVWNRPFDPLIILQSRDGVLYSAHDVRYTIEFGDTSTFGVNERTGELFINARKQFTLDAVHTLVVSAQSYGIQLATRAALAAPTSLTSIPAVSQAVNFKVGAKPPQFYASPFIVNFFENVTAGQRIGKLEATSFQNLPLSFTISPSSSVFSFDGSTGFITLNSPLAYIKNTRQYDFEATVTEGFSNFRSTTKLILRLHSTNHPPTFPVPYYVKYNVIESMAVGTKLLDLLVKDYDPGDLGRLEVVASDDTFKIAESNGVIALTIAKSLNYESLPLKRYEFTVSAIDHGWPRLTGSTNIQIFVDNVNNKAPVFVPADQVVTLQEGANKDLVVHYIQAFDPDGDNIKFKFNKAVLTQEYFSVNEDTGMITLIKNIDPGASNLIFFNLSITITDDSSCCPDQPPVFRSTTGFVQIIVNRVNTQPTFPSCRSYTPTVKEDSSVGNNSILTLEALDTDEGPNGELSFRIYGEETSHVAVRKRAGNRAELYLTQSISRNSADVLKFNDTFKYPVVVRATDQGVPALSVNCFLFVTIETINLTPPRFDYGEQRAYFYVTAASAGAKIVRVFAFDTDFGVNGQVSYAFSNNANSTCTSLFNLDSTNGWITWKGSSSAPSATIKCEVLARDNGVPSLSSPSTVYIELTNNRNLQPPLWSKVNGFDIDNYDFTIAENTALEREVLRLSATIAYDSNIEFFIPAENINVFNGEGNFGTNSSSTSRAGEMSIVLKKSLPEAYLVPFYFLRCRAFVSSVVNPVDRIAAISRLRVKISDVNNQAPKFLGMDSNGVYTAAVTPFTKAGDFVVEVTAVDMDKSWPNFQVIYSIQLGEGSNLFSINPNNGVLTVSSTAALIPGNPIFNPAIKAFYEIVVVAQDGADSAIPNVVGPNKVQIKVQVIVNGGKSSSPTFDRTFSTSISEVLPRFSHVINATASLPSNLPIGITALTQYDIVAGNEGRVFAVESKNGAIFNVGALDADKRSFYNLKYTVFDGLRVIGPVDVNITIIRANYRPVFFEASSYNYIGPSITEKDPNSVGTTLMKVNAKPTNNNQLISYSVTDPVKFTVDQSGNVKIGQPLSRDVPEGFAPQGVNVKAEAGGYSPGYALVTLDLADINDNKPLFDPCCVAGFINENIVGDAFRLKTFDADAGVNSEITYSMVGSSDQIDVTPDGWLKTKQPLNFENKQMYVVTVRATDKGTPPLTSDSEIRVYVSDVSEFPPYFPATEYDVSIDEELPLGSVVTSLRADDRDPMDNHTYSLFSNSGTDDHTFFYVENNRVFDGSYQDNNARMISSGVVKIAKVIDYDVTKKSLYTFIVQVTDTSLNQERTLVKIRVNDVNDNPPVITPSMTLVSLAGSDPVGKSVASFSAIDPDSGLNGQFSFSIDHENTDPMFLFGIDAASGQVTIQNPFNPDTLPNMMVTVLATDKGFPALTGRATLNVTISNILRAPTPALLPIYPVVLSPNTAKNSQVYCLSNGNSNYNYQLDCKAAPNCEDFTINQQGCLIANRNGGYSRKALDYNNYNIPVVVTNKNNNNNNNDPDLVTRQNIRLVMQGTTDTAPIAGSKQVHAVNFVDADGGYSQIPLGNVYVTDVDDWDLALKTFTLTSGGPFFFLNQDHKGHLFMRGDVREGSHEAKVEVKDGSFAAAVATMMVDVKIVNKTALDNAASMRISGLTDASDLLRKRPNSNTNRLESIQQTLQSFLGNEAVIEILSIGNVDYSDVEFNATDNSLVDRQVSAAVTNGEPLVDVLYAARTASNYFSPELLNALVEEKKSEIEKNAGVSVLMAPVDLCRSEFYNCWSDGCATVPVNARNQPRLINTNQTSFVGLNVDFKQTCSPMAAPQGLLHNNGVALCVPAYCLNGGVCVPNNAAIKCVCPPGFDGQRCQKTKVSFTDPGGFMLLPPMQQSEKFQLSLDLMIPTSSPSTTLLLYSGPTQAPSAKSFIINTLYDNQAKPFVSRDFLLLELLNGKPRLRLDFGDGEVNVELLGSGVPTLVDGKWHSLDVLIEEKRVTLMIDKCKNSQITENISSSTMDSSSCSATAQTTGERFLINSGSFPLQLGGRKDTSNTYPTNWVKERLRGCVRNLQVNSQLYDMSLGKHRVYEAAENNCRYEDCSICSSNSTCQVLGPPGTPVCHCPPGFEGNNCQTPTATRFYNENEFVQWKPTTTFINQMNTSQNWYSDNFQLMFRTRQENGILFTVQSFTDLERYILELKGGVPYFRFDLGSNDEVISLNGVKVNDGSWHWIRADRYGNQAHLRLDDGQGAKYNSTFPTNKHRYIKLFAANILGDLNYNEWSKVTTAENNLKKSCISDVRYNGNPLSLTTSSSYFSVTSQGGSDVGCDKSGACSSLNCVSGLVCIDLWQKAECRCEKFYPPGTLNVANADCISKTCLDNPCLNGGVCTVVDGKVVCICPAGFSGLSCEADTVVTGAVSGQNFNLVAAIVLPILLALLLLCLLLFLLWWCCCRNRERGLLYDEPDKDIRENVIAYDEEGVGEEDNYAFDLGRLHKSNMETENVKKSIDFNTIAPTLTATTKSAPTTGSLPGPYSSIADFISDKMNQADTDPENFNDDSKVPFEFEGAGSEAGTLSTLASSQGDRDADLDWLVAAGPRFGRLADMYGENERV